MKTLVILPLFISGFFAGAHVTSAAAIVPNSFSATWDTGVDTSVEINLGVCPTSIYWEEVGNSSNNGTSTSCAGGLQTIVFPLPGEYRTDFSGAFTSIGLIDNTNKSKFRTVEQWGNSTWLSFDSAFSGVTDLTFNATDVPDLSSLDSMKAMFTGATNFNSPLNNWDVSNVTTLQSTFSGATAFNQPLNNWDVSNVNMLRSTFNGATSFNQPLNNWDVSNVTTMMFTFYNATSFNQSLGEWDISGLTFSFASDILYNSGIDTANYSATLIGWASLPVVPSGLAFFLNNVPATYNSSAQAARDTLINDYGWGISDEGLYIEPIDNTFITVWDTRLASPTNELRIFASDADIGVFTIDWGDGVVEYYANNPGGYLTHTYATPGIKTVTITGTFPILYGACDEGDAYNKLIDVAQWGVTQWKYLDFNNCTYLTGFSAPDVPDLSNVVGMTEMFYNASLFNDDLNDWNVSNVQYMDGMFYGASTFNGNVSDWNVSNVRDMSYMFFNAATFNQRLDKWDISNVNGMSEMLTGTALSEAKYTKLLNSWATLPVRSFVGFNTSAQYCGTAQAARDILTTTYSWVISDGGSTDVCVVEEDDSSSNGGTSTRVGDRLQNKLARLNTSSTEPIVLGESLLSSIKKFVGYFVFNESQIASLPPNESKKVILLMRDIIVYLLGLIPGV